MGKAELFGTVKAAAQRRQSLYKGSIKDRQSLLDFLEMNNWFELTVADTLESMPSPKKLYVPEETAVALCERLSLWLDGYHRANREKLEILMRYGGERIPRTTSFYQEFIRRAGAEDDISSWRLLDFLLYHLPGEIMEITPEEASNLADVLDREATRAVSDLFARFNAWMQEKLGINGWRYRFEYRKKREGTEAYTLRQFTQMAYCLFNEEWWVQQKLVVKACESASFANLWAFIAMHFVCGLRSTDIVRLPKPDVGCEGELFRRNAVAGTLEKPEAIARDIQIRIRYRPKRPSKTLSASGIPDAKVFIPVSLERPIGIILGIAASHYEAAKPGEPFIMADRSISRTRSFLGNEFMSALGGKGFASSRANKAYLQGLEMMADTSEGSVRGYMIAALARSHKGGLGTLPNVTDIYLRDAAFSGYKPEFIAREMFERGIFGFVPHLLLETYAGENYAALSIRDQTKMIREIGIRPSGIENIVRICDSSLSQARNVVEEIVSSGADIPALLQEIASGRAASKQEGCLCAMSGGGFPCAFPDRVACVGCRYEIHTKSILHQLSSEYCRMRGLASGPDGWRYREMARKVILPVIGEYLAGVREGIPNADMDALSEIMEGGLSGYAYGSEQTGRDRLQPLPSGRRD
ncbi:MAG: hypothetical protein IKH57_17395 [Clostridia bacterium]|nr:hypothetical protein [Eubacterium sp.]MBR3018829.1 hypothetical protein [Clostridia bacterium]